MKPIHALIALLAYALGRAHGRLSEMSAPCRVHIEVAGAGSVEQWDEAPDASWN